MITTPERQRTILQHLRRHRRASVAELSVLTRVSEATIRRDLDTMEKAGCLVRAHGAALLPSPALHEPSYLTRTRRAAAAKQTIARIAREFCQDGMHVYLDAGSTTLELGRLLLDAERIHITTNSLPLAQLAAQAHRSIRLIGGEIRPVSQALIGTLALDWIAHLRFDLVFLAASGLDANGASTVEMQEAEIKAAVLARATRGLLLADLGKWNKPAAVQFAAWSDFDDWIVEAWPTTSLPSQKMTRPKGVRLHLPTPQ